MTKLINIFNSIVAKVKAFVEFTGTIPYLRYVLFGILLFTVMLFIFC